MVRSGPVEDDYTTQWRVDDGEKTVDYAAWLITIGGDHVRQNR